MMRARPVFLTLLLLVVPSLALAQRAPRAPSFDDVPAALNETIEFVPVVHFEETPLAELFQTAVVNPTIIEFTSVDHDAVDAGTAVITSYDVNLFTSTGGQIKTASIGKPSLVNGKVTYTSFNTVWTGVPAGQYNASITAKGPGGAATSPVSTSPFTVAARSPAGPGAPTFRQ